MHPVDVVVTSPETAQDGVAEFRVNGRLFAFTVLEQDELVLRLIPGDTAEPVIIGARSLMSALERAPELLS
jgi:hypothetical protein